MRMWNIVNLTVFILLSLTVIPVLNGAVIACNTAVNLSLFAAFGANKLLACKVSVILTYRICGRHRVIRKLIILRYLADKICRRLPVGKLFAEECMEYCTWCIKRLKLILNVKSREDVLGKANGKVWRVSIISRTVFICCNYIGIIFLIVLCKTEWGWLRRSCLKVVKVAVFFLIIGKALTHMIKNLNSKVLCFLACHIFFKPFSVKTCLIHTYKTYGGEMVVECAEVTLCVRVKSVVKELCDYRTLNFKWTSRNVHKLIKTLEEIFFIRRKVSDSWHIDCNNTDWTCWFAWAKETAWFFTELTKVKTQTAAHWTNVRRLHIRVNIVWEIWSTVFCGHLKKEFVILGFGPVKITCNGISGNGVLEASAVGVTLNHNFNERLIDHIHFFFAVFIFEIHFLAADNSVKLCKVIRNCPVKSNVGERWLCSPARWCIYTVNEGLYALLNLFVGKIVYLYKGS